MDLKTCTKCKEQLPATTKYFYKQKAGKYGLLSTCKKCHKEHYKEYNKANKDKRQEHYQKNKDKLKEYQKEYQKANKNKVKEYQKEHYEKNKDKIKEYQKEYYKSPAKFSTYNKHISYAEEIRESKDGFLEVRCTYCGKWYRPTNREIISRINALNGKYTSQSESRFYCSDNCKKECPIYYKQLYAADDLRSLNNNKYAREVQPELRKLVFERDDYTCIKCKSKESLHCHHIEGIRFNPIESADIDICATLCKDCHLEVHQQDGCGYHDLRCNE